jgi:hypothetical protein
MDERPAFEHDADEEISFSPRELEMIAEARASFERGDYVEWSDMKAWLESRGAGHDLPPPKVRHRSK